LPRAEPLAGRRLVVEGERVLLVQHDLPAHPAHGDVEAVGVRDVDDDGEEHADAWRERRDLHAIELGMIEPHDGVVDASSAAEEGENDGGEGQATKEDAHDPQLTLS
jgi:hypothetical protein